MVSHLYPVDKKSLIYYAHYYHMRPFLGVFVNELGKAASVFEVFSPSAPGLTSFCSLKTTRERGFKAGPLWTVSSLSSGADSKAESPLSRSAGESMVETFAISKAFFQWALMEKRGDTERRMALLNLLIQYTSCWTHILVCQTACLEWSNCTLSSTVENLIWAFNLSQPFKAF